MNNLCVEKMSGCSNIPVCQTEIRFSDISEEALIITSLLNQLGVPRNTAGYNYLLYIILKINKSKNYNIRLTTELYPQIADEMNSSVKRIERGLRYSIDAAWNRNKDAIKRILGYYDDCKPYSSEFIWLLADKFRMIDHRNRTVLSS